MIACVALTCLAEENTISPEREKALRELARQIVIRHEEELIKSEKQKGRLLYLQSSILKLEHTCQPSGDIWMSLLKNKSEFQEVNLLFRYCHNIENSVWSFIRKYEYADMAADDETKREIINKMLRQDIDLVKSELALYIEVIDIQLKDFISSYALSLGEDIKNHFITIDDDFNNLHLKGELLSVTH